VVEELLLDGINTTPEIFFLKMLELSSNVESPNEYSF
jgi:hypothetical protein